MQVRSLLPVKELCEEVEKRNKLRLLDKFLKVLVEEGSQDPDVHNAMGKILIDANSNPEHFLQSNPFYQPAVVGKYCEKRCAPPFLYLFSLFSLSAAPSSLRLPTLLQRWSFPTGRFLCVSLLSLHPKGKLQSKRPKERDRRRRRAGTLCFSIERLQRRNSFRNSFLGRGALQHRGGQ